MQLTAEEQKNLIEKEIKDYLASMEINPDIYEKLKEPHRKYHNEYHIHYLWNLYNKRSKKMSDFEKDFYRLVIIFHDIIYDIAKEERSNEEKSAEFFFKEAGKSKVGPDMFLKVYVCILLTNPKEYHSIEKYNDAKLYSDFIKKYDLYNLVDPRFNLDESSALIREEFSIYNNDDYKKATIDVFKHIEIFYPEAKPGIEKALNFLNFLGEENNPCVTLYANL
jgi:predicted metal-dependent HD superfamily phosphohydrolase